ncbi:MAG: FMN-binding protein [Bacteroidales bacterium]|jgi:Na+-transporting NADH:ubiquinone oxidoreductase subunit C|nr:FMN-binding protein [Bacteroidales bacterium]
MFSNKYIFVYSTVLVVVAAAILAIAAVGLKPYQDANVRIETKQQLLSCVGIDSTPKNAETLYAKYFTEELYVNAKGEIVTAGEDSKPVYVCNKDGEKIYVVPVQGKGLWGAIWGNVALAEDLTTITGVNFDHKSETPGLGAEITTKPFQQEFNGKRIFDGSKFTSVKVDKRMGKDNPHAVDAISGGTITSRGVSAMLHDCLEFYVPYFNNLKAKH